MYLAERLRQFREAKSLSQGDIEKRTGLHRCYISRVENGHTVPALETLEKMARALEVPMYQLFYEDEESPRIAEPAKSIGGDGWPTSRKERSFLKQLTRHLSRMDPERRRLLLFVAGKMSTIRKRK